MSTRLTGQIDPNTRITSIRQSPTDDVWNTIPEVIGDWGLGQADLWARVVTRHDEVLKTGAVEAVLFHQLNFGVHCTCKKSETGQVNQRCAVCYGSLFVGGFEKSGYNTIFLAPSSTSIGGATQEGLIGSTAVDNPTLTNVVVKAKLPDQAELAEGATSGTILSPVFQITSNLGFIAPQLVGADGLRVLTTTGILVEYTADNGTTWINLLTGDTTPLSEPAVNVQFRVTLSRAKPTDPSPFFQLLRARFQMNIQPRVLISKKSFPEQRVLESFGVRISETGITWWTTPSLGRLDGTETFIQENDIFEITSGHYKKQNGEEEYPLSGRYKPSNVTYVEPFNRFLSQRFNIRLLQTDEPGNKVF